MCPTERTSVTECRQWCRFQPSPEPTGLSFASGLAEDAQARIKLLRFS